MAKPTGGRCRVPSAKWETLLSDLFVVQVPQRWNYTPKDSRWQTEQSALGRVPYQETIGSGLRLCCLIEIQPLIDNAIASFYLIIKLQV